METFEKYLEKMGYSWNDFDHTYEMENLIEQYANEKVKQALTIPPVVEKSEQCDHDYSDGTGTGWNVCKKCGDTY